MDVLHLQGLAQVSLLCPRGVRNSVAADSTTCLGTVHDASRFQRSGGPALNSTFIHLYHYTACILGHVLFENLSPDLKNLAK